jgi:membrane protein EpsK
MQGAVQATGLRQVKKGRLSINLVTNVGNLVVSTALGILYVPFLVRALGPAVYGLIPLATVITSYMGIITLGLNSAVARSITIALEKEDDRKANLIFNTSLWGSVILMLALFAPAIATLVFLDRVVVIPPGLGADARVLFGCVAAAFLLNQIKTPFEVSSFCRNRFDLRNAVELSELSLRIGLIFFLFVAVMPRASFVGVGILVGTTFSFGAVVALWKRLTPTLRISAPSFDWITLKELTRTGFWVVTNHLGALLYLGVDLVIANRLFGAETSGRYAAVLQLAIFIRSLSGSIGPVFTPTALCYYAKKDLPGLVAFLRSAMKLMGLLLLLPIALTCGFARPLLILWLGPSFAEMGPLLFFMTVHLCVNLTIGPLLALQLTTNRVKTPGIVTLVLGFTNFVLAIVLARQWGLYGIVAAGAITLTAKNLFFTPLYAARILHQRLGAFVSPLAPTVLATFAVIAVCQTVGRFVEITTWLQLIAVSTTISLGYLAGAYRFLLDARERKQVQDLFIRWRSRST